MPVVTVAAIDPDGVGFESEWGDANSSSALAGWVPVGSVNTFNSLSMRVESITGGTAIITFFPA
jgi:hypothetical protein